MSRIDGWLDSACELDALSELCRKEGTRLATKDPQRAGTAFLACEYVKQAATWLRQLADSEPTQPNARMPLPPPIPRP